MKRFNIFRSLTSPEKDLHRSGLRVEDSIVLLDRNQEGCENLKKLGIKAHS